MPFRSGLLPSDFPFHSRTAVLLCVKNGWESQRYCKGAVIKFVPTINVSVIGRGEGRGGAGEEGVIEQSTINGGKVTRHHNPLQL